MSTYRTRTSVPPLVQRALDLARRQRFEKSCSPEVGRLLSILASHVQHGVIGEIGTGTGVGAAWMLSHLTPTTRFFTVEADSERAMAAKDLFQDMPNAQVIHGDWRELLAYGPFDLLFLDAGPAKAPSSSPEGEAAVEMILSSLRHGGMMVMDDLTPEEYWPQEWSGQPDPVREFWLNDARLNAIEVLTTPQTITILATRISE